MAGRYNPERHNRRSIRLKGYDYAQSGAYFVTICTQNRECLFGDIQHFDIVLNDAGQMMKSAWNDLSIKCPNIVIDEFIVMPNHVHGIIFIVGAPLACALEGMGALSKRTAAVKNRAGIAKDRAGTRPAPTIQSRTGETRAGIAKDRAGTRPAPTIQSRTGETRIIYPSSRSRHTLFFCG